MRRLRPSVASPPMTAVPMATVRRMSRLEVEEKKARWYKPKPRVTDDRALAEPWGKRSSQDCCQDVAKMLPRCCHVLLTWTKVRMVAALSRGVKSTHAPRYGEKIRVEIIPTWEKRRRSRIGWHIFKVLGYVGRYSKY